MADTCIVCLGDLAVRDPQSLSQLQSPTISPEEVNSSTKESSKKRRASEALYDEDAPDIIAHLLPCGHDLHNECLKPWVERANSCPICRRTFNEVELKHRLDGPCISSYAVQDKQQVADIDPSMVIDDDIDEEDDDVNWALDTCVFCEGAGEDDTLLLCDGCNVPCHITCAGLDGVPYGPWFCHICHEEGTVHEHMTRRQNRINARRRRRDATRDGPSTAWALVWQSVWDHLNLDLDFPFDDDAETFQRTEAQRSEIQEWQQRLRVAERQAGQGAAARFRNTAAALLESRGRERTPRAESQEELRAWNAFEKAKELSSVPEQVSSTRRAKQASATASPSEPAPEPERKLKRPRTRRNQTTDALQEAVGEPSQSTKKPEIPAPIMTENNRVMPEANTGGASFFQSLLKEVANTTPVVEDAQSEAGMHQNGTTSHEHSSPGSASPLSSPSTSNHPSPRARSLSPPPTHWSRGTSPPPLTSRIEPVFARAPQFSPASPADNKVQDATISTKNQDRKSNVNGDTRTAKDSSPTRPNMSFSAKAEIQKMVASALKPAYHKKEIDTAQFTGINRDISRMLYDKIGDAGGLGSEEGDKRKWQDFASHEVKVALKKLKIMAVETEG